MRIGAMQPYLFPYLGYFQLIAACDAFIFLDDVQYIRRGWINRNFIRSAGRRSRFTLPVAKAPVRAEIRDIEVDSGRYERFRQKFFTSLRHSYGQAQCFDGVYPLIESVFVAGARNLCELACSSVTAVCECLDITPSFYRASEVAPSRTGSRSEQMLALVKAMRGGCYVNPVAGVGLYNAGLFRDAGVELFALTPAIADELRDPAENRELSVIDNLMRFNPEYLQYAIRNATVHAP